MAHRLWAILVFACAAEVCSLGDGTTLVQRTLHRNVSVDPDPSNTTIHLTANGSSNNSELIIELPRLYSINFTRTFGDDHFCVTEIEFYDIEGNTLDASYVSMSSCYGCAIDCDGCTVDYGNPHMLFDKSSLVEAPGAWSCSDVGSFKASGSDSAYGSSVLTFKVEPRRPAKYSVRRSNINGAAITRDWAVHEQQKDGSWALVSTVVDAPKALNQTYDMMPDMGSIGRWWEWADPACLSDYNGDGVVARVQLDYQYDDTRTPLMTNNCRGVHFDDNFGFLKIDGATYKAKQVHIVPASTRAVGSEEVVKAPLELRIVHQKLDSPGFEDIAVVAVPLRLPLESESLETESEQMFVSLGLTTPITEGTARNIPHSFNFSVFKQELEGGANQLPCAGEDPRSQKWFITDPALVTGDVATAFKEMFPTVATAVGEESTESSATPPVGIFDGLGYNQLGRQSYGGLSSSTEPLQPGVDPQNLVDQSAGNNSLQWVHNPVFQPQHGEWVSAGEWKL